VPRPHRLAGPLLLIVCTAIAGCGGDTTTTTLPVGDAEIQIETREGNSPADVARTSILAVLDQGGFPANVVACYERELEKVPDADLVADFQEAAAQGADTAEALRAIRPIKTELSRTCLTGDTLDDFDPSTLDEDNAAVLKEGFINQLDGRLLADLPSGPRLCVIAKVEELSPEAFLRVINSTPREISRTFAQYGRSCRT